MGRYLGLGFRVVLFVLLHIPALIFSVPAVCLGYQIRRPKQEAEERPADQAEQGSFDDDQDPNRRRHKFDFSDYENIRRCAAAMAEDPCEPTIPTEVWAMSRKVRRA